MALRSTRRFCGRGGVPQLRAQLVCEGLQQVVPLQKRSVHRCSRTSAAALRN